jgi:hypothetical protein
MSHYIEPFPLRDAVVFFTIWKLGEFDYVVTISYEVRGQVGHDNRQWPFRSLEQARAALPPTVGACLARDPDDDPRIVESWT